MRATGPSNANWQLISAPGTVRAAPYLLLGTAALLIAAQWTMAWLSPGWPQRTFQRPTDILPVVLLLAIPAAIGLAIAPLLGRTQPGRSSIPLWAMVAAGLAMRAVWLGVPVAIDDDYYRYLWDGAMVATGNNPYGLAPLTIMRGEATAVDIAALAKIAMPILKGINFPELITIYPGTSQAAFALAYWIAPFELDGLRIVFLAADGVALALLLAILRQLERPPALAALYWLNPLVVWSTYGTVHTEALIVPLVLGACLAAWRSRQHLAAGLLALAVGVKIWPVLLVPLFARLAHARGARLLPPALTFTAVSALVLAPLLQSSLAGMRSGLVVYSSYWWINNAPFSWISYWVHGATSGTLAGQQALRGAIAAAMGLAALWVARRPPGDLRSLLTSATIIAALTFYLSPAQFPWYALWFLGLAAALEWHALLLASATLAIYYFTHVFSNMGAGQVHNYGIAALHALPVWAWLLWERCRAAPARTSDGAR